MDIDTISDQLPVKASTLELIVQRRVDRHADPVCYRSARRIELSDVTPDIQGRELSDVFGVLSAFVPHTAKCIAIDFLQEWIGVSRSSPF